MLPVSPYNNRTKRHSTPPLLPLKMTDMASLSNSIIEEGSSSTGTSTTNLLEVWLTKSHVMLKKRGQFVDSLWYSREDASVFLGTSKCILRRIYTMEPIHEDTS